MKKTRRVISLILALMLIAGQIPASAFATEGGVDVPQQVQEPAPQPQPQPLPENTPAPKVETKTEVVAAPSQGTPVTTTSSETKSNESTGSYTTTTTTTTTGGGVEGSSKTVESSQFHGQSSSTTHQAQQTTTTQSPTTVTTTTNADTKETMKVVTESTTTVVEQQSSQQSEQKTLTVAPGTQANAGAASGQSSQTTTDTTTTVTENFNQVISDTTTSVETNDQPNPLQPTGTTGDGVKVEGSETTGTLPTTEQEGTKWNADHDDDGKDDVTQGEAVVDEEKSTSTKETVILYTPKNPGITLDMMNSETDEAQIEITLDTLKAELDKKYEGQEGWSVVPYNQLDADGKEVLGEDGKPIQLGWKAIKVDETTTRDFEDVDDSYKPVTDSTTDSGVKETGKGEAYISKHNVELKEYEDKVANTPEVKEDFVSDTDPEEKGTKTTTYEKVYRKNDDGSLAMGLDGKPIFIGYKVTTTVETKKIVSDETTYTDDANIIETPADKEIFELPTRPQPSTTTDEDGYTTTVTVTDIIENGKVVGYQTNTVVTNEKGETLYSESAQQFARTGTETEEIVKDPETQHIIKTQLRTYTSTQMITADEWSQKVSVEMEKTQTSDVEIHTQEEIYSLADGKPLYFYYNGRFYAAEGINIDTGDLKKGVTLNQTANDQEYDNFHIATPKDDNNPNGTVDLREDSYNDEYTVILLDENGNVRYDDDGKIMTRKIRNTDINFGSTGDRNTGEYTHDGRWAGKGLVSDITIYDSGNSAPHTPSQYIIKIGGKEYIAYCVELGANLYQMSQYFQTVYGDGQNNSEGSQLHSNNANSTVANVREVAVNGFWGTESGMGSLQAVKDFMKRNNISQEYIDMMTPGMALTATQMAIWKYGNNMNPANFMDANGNLNASNVNDDEKEAIKKLYNLLISVADGNTEKDEGTKSVVQEITAASITGASIKLNEKITPDGAAEEKYDTDVSFKMDVSTSSINGDLVLKFTDGNNKVQKYRLAGENEDSIFDGFINRLTPDENGVYTIKNVVLKSGERVDITIQGIQDVDDGIYIYNSNVGGGNAYNSQDFVGLSIKQRTVAIEFGVKMEAVDPGVSYGAENKDTYEDRTDTKRLTTTEQRTDTWKMQKVETEGDMDQTDLTRRIVRGKITSTKVLTAQTKENMRWEAYMEYLLTTTDGGDGFGFGGAGGAAGGLTIPDEMVPLAVAPATGDSSLIFAATSVISLAAYILLSRKPKLF